MDLDVIDATAEALPLELLNKVNKELTAQLSHAEQQLDEKARGIEDQRKRLQFMKEHLSNVRAEIVNTQGLTDSKQREVESEENMARLIERECARLSQRATELARNEAETQDKLAALQNRIFQGNLKMEEFKKAMDFNQEELEQWDEARRQKEEDELAIAQYSKQDEAKMKKLTMKVEKLEATVREQRRLLEEEIVQTQHAQAEMDRCADEYRQLHEDRGGLLDEWEQVVRVIAERDEAIRVAAEQYAEGVEWLAKRDDVRKDLDKQLRDAKEQLEVINYTIAQREKQAQQYREAVPNLTQQVQSMDDEIAAMRERVNRSARDCRNTATNFDALLADIDKASAELEATQQRRQQAADRLEDEITAAKDMRQQTDLITQLFKDAQKANETLERDVEQLKKLTFKANQELATVRDTQNLALADISGSQAQGKNLNAKISQLDAESFTQQGVLYNIEFSVQQMEKKVNRAKGERTEEERKELHEKIDLLQSTLDELEQQWRTLDQQVKRVREEVRKAQLEIRQLEAAKKTAEEKVLEINLQCGHSEQELKKLEKVREDELIKVDTMELQLNRLKRALRHRSSELVDLEERKRQLTSDVAEREAEIAVHHDLLRMEGKLVEEDRRKLYAELQDRQKGLTAIKNRHEVLVGRMDPAQARLSQAQLVVEAAKERENLQFRGDSLDSRIKRMEREMLKLEKTIAVIKASNNNFKHKFDKVSSDHEEVLTQKALQEKARELKTAMSRRALETNDYQAALDAKQNELLQLSLGKEQADRLLQDLRLQCEQATQEVVQSREAVVRYEQAISKARGTVPENIRDDIQLQESRERLALVVGRLLECSQKAGEEIYEAVQRMVVESQLPVAPPAP